jgi:subtilisin family serine protease
MNRRRLSLAMALTLVLLLAALPTAHSAAPGRPISATAPAQATPRVGDRVWAALGASGRARVIVALHDPVGPASELRQRAQAVVHAQAGVLGRLAAHEFTLIHRYTSVPALAGIITPHGATAIQNDPLVESIYLDEPGAGHLAQSVAALGADVVHSSYGFNGQGVTVAVLDTGANTTHPDLSGAIVAQQCFTNNSCPPSNTATGSSAQDQNGHGTNVTGIIASRGIVSSVGFAPGAQIVAVRVLDSTGAGFVSDWVAGLDWVRANQAALNVRIINMSLGTFALYSGNCDAQEPTMANIVGQLTAAGVAIFASTGNQGSVNRIASPACNSGVIGVGATYDSDLGPEPDSGTYQSGFGSSWPACADNPTSLQKITCFTNSAATMDIVAPGAQITATGLGGGTLTYWGTSQASPTAAGIAALMLQAQPALTPAQIETTLKTTGTPLTDAKNGLNFPLINALNAIISLRSYGVVAKADPPALTTNAGTTVTYTAALTNTATVSDTIDVSVSGNTWSTVAPPSLGPLLAGGSATFSVTVTVPPTATDGQTDTAVITLRSRGDPTKSADVVLTTTAERRRLYLALIQL